MRSRLGYRAAMRTAHGWALGCAGLACHGLLGRPRLAAWEPDWQLTEPPWTGGR